MTNFQGLRYTRELSESSATLGDDLEKFLDDVGTHVLAWVRHGKSNLFDLELTHGEACRRDALGYSGARGLACSPVNVPAGTVTALWCPGLYQGQPWIPLLMRRGYLKHLVLI
jgi:hypothetical protein